MNILALLWGGAMILNLMWWTNDPASLRVLTNPTAKQSDYGLGQLVNFHIGFLNSIPLMELVIGAVVVVGAVYYALVGRTKEFSTVVPPAEDLAGIAPATAS